MLVSPRTWVRKVKDSRTWDGQQQHSSLKYAIHTLKKKNVYFHVPQELRHQELELSRCPPARSDLHMAEELEPVRWFIGKARRYAVGLGHL